MPASSAPVEPYVCAHAFQKNTNTNTARPRLSSRTRWVPGLKPKNPAKKSSTAIRYRTVVHPALSVSTASSTPLSLQDAAPPTWRAMESVRDRTRPLNAHLCANGTRSALLVDPGEHRRRVALHAEQVRVHRRRRCRRHGGLDPAEARELTRIVADARGVGVDVLRPVR